MDSSAPDVIANLAALRTEYMRGTLDEKDVDPNPLAQFALWLSEAIAAGVNEPNAMTLATCTPASEPSARVVLLKGVDGDAIVFFTNYRSRKGRELAINPRAAAVFFWPELERQVRFEGSIARTSREVSEQYFRTRPAASRIGAAVSHQSEPVTSRAALEAMWRELEARHPDGGVPCPIDWGGYRLTPDHVEFWQGRPSRLHDRVLYVRQDQAWTRQRLAP